MWCLAPSAASFSEGFKGGNNDKDEGVGRWKRCDYILSSSSRVMINGEEIRKEDVAIVDSTQLWNNACEHHSL